MERSSPPTARASSTATGGNSSLYNVGRVHVGKNIAVVSHALDGTKVVAKTTVASGASPLDECHTLFLLVADATAELAGCCKSSNVGIVEGLHVISVECGARRKWMLRTLSWLCNQQVIKTFDPVSNLYGPSDVANVLSDSLNLVSDGAFFRRRERHSCGKHNDK